MLAAWMVSGDIFKTVAFLKTQSNLSAHPGRLEPKNNTRQHENAGVAGVVSWTLIYIFQAHINQIADFLADCFSDAKSYSTIKKVNDQHFHQLFVRAIMPLLDLMHPIITRLLKGVYDLRPPGPRYSSILGIYVFLPRKCQH